MKKAISLAAPLALITLLHACRTLAPHADLLVENRLPASTPSVSVTYLGCNGFLIRSANECILIDPCFTRPSALNVILNRPIPANLDRIDAAVAKAGFPEKVDAILVTHAHYDHLLDVPAVQKQFGGRLLASPTGCFLAQASGVAENDLDPVLPGSRRKIGGAVIQVLDAEHDLVLGRIPYPGQLTELPENAPTRPKDYVCGQPLAFLIEIGGKTIYADSGGRSHVLPPRMKNGIDLAIIGAALPDSRRRFIPAVDLLQPRLVYPSHQDNFFRPADQPYRFNWGTDFPALKREFEKADTGAEMILFDFFQTLDL